MDEIKQNYLKPESEHPTWDEMRAFVNSSLTGISQPVRVISQQIESAGYVENTDANEGKGWRFDAQGNLYANDGNFRGDITGASGTFSGTLSGNTIIGATIKTSTNAGAGVNSVIMDTDGIRGYDSVLGNTFNLPTDGSAPTFSSGIINEVIFEISTNAVLRTSETVGDGSASSAGVLINNTGVYICEANQAVAAANFKALINGTISIKGSLTITGGTGIANLDGGDLVTVNEADVNALNLTNAPAAAGADVTGDNVAASVTGQGDLALLSVIGNAYITDLAVSKLTAGSILSKAISLGVTGGTGDCYISGGAGLDYANWHADKGFILGIDDSDSDLAKFFIGDDANNTYLGFDGVNTNVTGARFIGVYECGEDIAANKVVCVAGQQVEETLTEDSYIEDSNPDTNYGTSNTLKLGADAASNDWNAIYLKIPTTGGNVPADGKNIIKVELMMYCTSQYQADGEELSIRRVSIDGANWTEAAITHNNAPVRNDVLQTTYFTKDNYIVSGSPQGEWLTFDITQIWKRFKNAEFNNWGLTVGSEEMSGASHYLMFASAEHATAAYRPKLRFTILENDGKVYIANCDDYKLCRNIIGISAEAKTTGQDIKILKNGSQSDISTGGKKGNKQYLNTTGGVDLPATTWDRHILIGNQMTDADKMEIDIQRQDYLVEEIPYVPNTGSTERIYVLRDTMKVDIVMSNSLDVDRTDTVITIRRGEVLKIRKRADAAKYITIDFSNANWITITDTTAASSYTGVRCYN